MNTRWYEISGWFLQICLFHLWRAARSAAPWFGSQSHSTASPHKRYFWFSLNVFFVAGETAIVYLFPVYLFYYLYQFLVPYASASSLLRLTDETFLYHRSIFFCCFIPPTRLYLLLPIVLFTKKPGSAFANPSPGLSFFHACSCQFAG